MPKGKHWKDIRETTVNVGMAIQDAMREIEKANPDKPKLHISIICPLGQRMQSFWNGYIEVNLVKKKTIKLSLFVIMQWDLTNA